MTDISIPGFHLGFLLSTALFCAVIHMMIVIGKPDLSAESTRQSWLKHIRFARFFIMLPLVFFFFSYFPEDSSVLPWSTGTLLVSTLLFVPIVVSIRSHGVTQGNHRAHPQFESHDEKIKFIKSLRPRHHEDRHQPQNINIAQTNSSTTDTTTPDLETTPPHPRSLVSHLAIGMLLGAAIVTPMLVAVLCVALATKLQLMTTQTAALVLRFIPGMTSLCIPFVMPFSFLVFGPWILRHTEGANPLLEQEAWRSRWNKLIDRARMLGYRYLNRTHLYELPWTHTESHGKRSFYLGWPAAYNPFYPTIFLAKDLDKTFSTEEVDFILAREASHGLRRHPVVRTKLGLAVFMFFVCTQLLSLLLRAPVLSFTFAIISVFFGVILMKKQGEVQELEADILAIRLQGISRESLNIAKAVLQKFSAGPHMQKRILTLDTLFRPEIDKIEAEQETKQHTDKKAA